MNAFLTTHRLHLTPLSPIHIGCGEDFEPTNYVIEKGLLYGFDPSRAALNDLQRSKILEVARRGALSSIQCFFRDNAATFKPHAYVVMPVCKGVAHLYEQRIGKAANTESNGNVVFNKLIIERHVYTGALQLPFIPGTSFKGALRTAWIDDLNAKRKPHDVRFKHNGEAQSSADLEKRLLQGDFATSPLRLLKVADLMPVREPEREVLFAVNRKKRAVMKDGVSAEPKGVATRKDCILPGQYRLFAADVTLPALQGHLNATNLQGEALTPHTRQLTGQGRVDLLQLAQRCNTYHLQRLRCELAVLDGRGFVNSTWKRCTELLLSGQSTLGRKLQTGHAFLIRIGRYGGADSKTLTGEGVASIKIMGGKGTPPTFESTTKTVWLAAQNDDDQKHLIPFGWAVVEIDPQEDCTDLQDWCQAQAQGRPDMGKIRADLLMQRQTEQAKKIGFAAQAAALQAQKQAAVRAQEEREQALKTMSAQRQEVEKLRQACQELAAKLPPHGKFKKDPADSNKPGLYKQAYELVNKALSDSAWSSADRCALADMLESDLGPVISGWDAKAQRKKLQCTALRAPTA